MAELKGNIGRASIRGESFPPPNSPVLPRPPIPPDLTDHPLVPHNPTNVDDSVKEHSLGSSTQKVTETENGIIATHDPFKRQSKFMKQRK